MLSFTSPLNTRRFKSKPVSFSVHSWIKDCLVHMGLLISYPFFKGDIAPPSPHYLTSKNANILRPWKEGSFFLLFPNHQKGSLKMCTSDDLTEQCEREREREKTICGFCPPILEKYVQTIRLQQATLYYSNRLYVWSHWVRKKYSIF